mmetsp:Transcript_22552/g.24660  ORF Transcript_22552/g.24660 Transcript_22552/m.24660 type:complete len:286 (-) Transcript_22552:171-1028(-)
MLWTFILFICLSILSVAYTKSKISSLTMKRILSEWKEVKDQQLSLDIPFQNTSKESGIRLSPLKNNLLEWHFSFTGMKGSDYEDGIYHGVIFLNPEYPRKAPRIAMITPSGRWAVGKDICLSASNYHQETWNPNWNLRTLILSLRGFMTTMAGEIGSITTDRATHRLFAGKSRSFFCPLCGMHHASISEEVPSQPIPSSSMRRYFIRNEEILTKKNSSPPSSSLKEKKKSLTAKNQGNARQGTASLTALKSSLFKFMVFSLSFTFFFLLNRQIAEHSFNLYLNQS